MTAHRVTTNPLSDALANVLETHAAVILAGRAYILDGDDAPTDDELDVLSTAYTDALTAYYAVVHNSGADMAALAVVA